MDLHSPTCPCSGCAGEPTMDSATAHSGATAATRDVIQDFAHLADTIDVAAIDAIAGGGNNAFDFIGAAAFSAAGQVRAFQSGANTILAFNTVGAAGAEMSVLLANVTANTLTEVDFVL